MNHFEECDHRCLYVTQFVSNTMLPKITCENPAVTALTNYLSILNGLLTGFSLRIYGLYGLRPFDRHRPVHVIAREVVTNTH